MKKCMCCCLSIIEYLSIFCFVIFFYTNITIRSASLFPPAPWTSCGMARKSIRVL